MKFQSNMLAAAVALALGSTAHAFPIAECPVKAANGAITYEPCVRFMFWVAGNFEPVPNTPAMPSLGTTKATIHSQFPVVTLYNFTYSPTINITVANMADVYLARLSRQYYIETKGNVAPLLAVAAKRLTAANLLRLQSAFGAAATTAAVNAYAPAAVKAAYGAGGTRAAVARSQAMYIQKGISGVTPSPNLDMTLYEIFLDYVTSGSSGAAALASTATYAGAQLAASFTVGYQIGSVVYWVDDAIDPDINIWIGDEEGAAVNDVIDYVSNPANYPSYDDGNFGNLDDTWKWDDVQP